MSQTLLSRALSTIQDQTPRELSAQAASRSGQSDHAFPMLSANKSAFPPEFRFMWASR